MKATAGTKLWPYEIVGPLPAGLNRFLCRDERNKAINHRGTWQGTVGVILMLTGLLLPSAQRVKPLAYLSIVAAGVHCWTEYLRSKSHEWQAFGK